MNHPLRGTCNDTSCPHHGCCHCGCGARSNIAPAMARTRNITRGMPHVYLRYHRQRTWGQPPHFQNGPRQRVGMSARILLPDLEAAIRLYGSADRVAELIGYTKSMVSKVRRGHVKTVRFGAAQRIAELARGTRTSQREPLTIRNTINQRRRRSER